MRKRLLVALALAFASFLLAMAFAIVMGVCGAMEQGASTDPAIGSYGPRCVPVFHPFAPVWAGFALLGMASLWWWRPWPVVVLGSVGLVLGVLAGFSAGSYGIGCGALLLASGLVAVRRREPGQRQAVGPSAGGSNPSAVGPPAPRLRSQSASSGSAARLSS